MLEAESYPRGGRQTPGVVRACRTVRRPTGLHSSFVQELLSYLGAVGFEVMSRLLGVNERGREVLTFVEGEVLHDYDVYSPSDARMADAALIRRCHAATVGSPLAGGVEFVCHNELGPMIRCSLATNRLHLWTGMTWRPARAYSIS